MEDVVKKLIEKDISIATMESCTGGALASAITSVEGASAILKFSAVTYSNEYKIKMGVASDVIDKYGVYSFETAKEMSKSISNFSNSDIGIGITGKINREDPNNLNGSTNIIYISIYFKNNDYYYNYKVEAIKDNRVNNKKYIVNSIVNNLLRIL